MKYQKKSLISIIMTLLIFFTIIPLESMKVYAAGSTINKVNISLQLPGVGPTGLPAAQPVPAGCSIIGGENYSIVGAHWFKSSGEGAGLRPLSFEEGEAYFVEIELCPDSGWMFTEDTDITIAGTAAKLRSLDADDHLLITTEDIVISDAINIDVSIIWDDNDDVFGKRPDSVDIQLFENNSEVNGKRITLDWGNGWSGHFTGLPRKIDGRDAVYMVEPYKYVENVPGYIIDSGIYDNNYTITCTYDTVYRYDLWVGGYQVTEDNKNDVMGDGKVTFDPDNNTLTFIGNPTITDDGFPSGAVITAVGMDITITGKALLMGGSYGIWVQDSEYGGGALTFDNADLIEAHGGDYGIRAAGDINVNGGKVYGGGTRAGIYAEAEFINKDGEVTTESEGYGLYANTVKLCEGTGVTYSHGTTGAIHAEDEIIIGKTHAITYPIHGLYYDTDILKGDFTTKATAVTVEPSNKTKYEWLDQHTDTWYYIVNGKVSDKYTGLTQHYELGTWQYIKNGKFDPTFSGIAMTSGGSWYYVKNGIRDLTFTGKIAKATNGIWYYVTNGKPDKTFSGIAQATNGVWYYCSNGKIDKTFNGIAKATNGVWYYVKNSKIDKTYKGAAKATNGIWYYVSNGKIDKTFSGIAKGTDGKWYYISKGKNDKTFNGIAKATDGVWYYVKNGTVNTTYTGVALATNGVLYYVKNSKIDYTFTGLARGTDLVWYYVKNGKVDKTYTGNYTYKGKTYKIVKGVVQN